jgi:hypothetical protein
VAESTLPGVLVNKFCLTVKTNVMKSHYLSRRDCLRVSAFAGCSVLLDGKVSADQLPGASGDNNGGPTRTAATGQLQALMEQLGKAPRRRSFRTVPMILDTPNLWDAEALDAVIGYPGRVKQVLDNTEVGGPWLNAMRNALNTQVFSFRNPDFLEVSATHGSAQFALYDEEMWDKYQLARMTGGSFITNRLIEAKDVRTDNVAHKDPDSTFGPAGNTVPILQQRGVVFMACHNAIWEHSATLLEKGINPDKLSHEAVAAELTNHLVAGVILTPGMAGTLPQLQRAGFCYAK